jgi:hypothetical protein
MKSTLHLHVPAAPARVRAEWGDSAMRHGAPITLPRGSVSPH